MGNIQSNKTKQVLADYTNIVNSTVANVYNNAAASCASANTFSLETGGAGCPFEMIDGNFNILQTAGSNCKFNNQNINSLSAEFINQITNNTRQFIQQESQNKQGWFATAFSLQINDASNVDQVMTQISNSFDTNFTNMCSSVSDAFNDAIVKLCGIYSGTNFNFTQNALVTAITSCVNENTINVWTNNNVLNNLWQATDQKLASEQSGFSFKWLIIIVIIIIIVMVIMGLLYYLMNKRKNKPSKNAMGSMRPPSLAGSDRYTNLGSA